jgi:hypothetical protein
MALFKEIYYGAIYVGVLELTVPDTQYVTLLHPQRGLEVDRIDEYDIKTYIPTNLGN